MTSYPSLYIFRRGIFEMPEVRIRLGTEGVSSPRDGHYLFSIICPERAARFYHRGTNRFVVKSRKYQNGHTSVIANYTANEARVVGSFEIMRIVGGKRCNNDEKDEGMKFVPRAPHSVILQD